jgi:hypothetical protein
MRTVLLTLAIVACSAPPKKVETIGNEGHDVPATCCCKSFPITADDAKPVYEMQNRMECSTHQGECVPDVQCNGSARPAQEADQKPQPNTGVPPPPPLPPSVN